MLLPCVLPYVSTTHACTPIMILGRVPNMPPCTQHPLRSIYVSHAPSMSSIVCQPSAVCTPHPPPYTQPPHIQEAAGDAEAEPMAEEVHTYIYKRTSYWPLYSFWVGRTDPYSSPPPHIHTHYTYTYTYTYAHTHTHTHP